jgi:hypothetical protein
MPKKTDTSPTTPQMHGAALLRTHGQTHVRVQYLLVKQLVPATFNPPVRTEDVHLILLKKSTKKWGVLSPLHIHHCPQRGIHYVVVDGCRRLASAIANGEERVPCIIHSRDCDSEEIWAELSRSTRAVSAHEWLYAWFVTDDRMRDHMPKKVWANIYKCLEIFGSRAHLRALAEARLSPSIAKYILAFHRHMLRRIGSKIGSLTPKDIGDWVVTHRLHYAVGAVCKMNVPPTKLRMLLSRCRDGLPFSLDELAA